MYKSVFVAIHTHVQAIILDLPASSVVHHWTGRTLEVARTPAFSREVPISVEACTTALEPMLQLGWLLVAVCIAVLSS